MAVSKYAGAKCTLWRVRYTTPDGKRTDKRGFRTKREAELWEAENVVAIRRGEYISPAAGKVRMSSLLDEFMSMHGSLAPTTQAARVSIARTWVAPHWDNWPVGSVTPASVHEWLHTMRQKSASEHVVEKAYRVLNGTLEHAVDRRLIAVNPMPKLKLKKQPVKKRAFLTNTQVVELAKAIDPRYRLLIGVLAYTGLRFGEAAALRVGDVDIHGRRIDVRHAVAEVNGMTVEGAPKGGRARTVPLPEFLVSEMTEAIATRKPTDLVFAAPRGGFIHLTTWRRRTFNPAIAAINETRRQAGREEFPKVTPHDLRHTAASLAVASGANVKVLQRVMGHSSASLTLDVYADLYESDLTDFSHKMTKLAAQTEGFPWKSTKADALTELSAHDDAPDPGTRGSADNPSDVTRRRNEALRMLAAAQAELTELAALEGN